MAQNSLYDTDIVAWAEQQVDELRRFAETASSNAIDWDNVIEEVASVGRSELSSVERYLVLVLARLLKWLSVPEVQATRGWRAEVLAYQQIARKRFSPAMRRKLDLDEIWSDARKSAETGLAYFSDEIIGGLPDQNPFTLDDLIAVDFDVDAAFTRLARSVREPG
jgi:hypothetical protein